jgi:hypothetical protein
MGSLLGRKRKTGPRNVFIRGWLEKFTELCGKPLVPVVVVITFAAFGEEMTEEAIRDTLKATTRADRRAGARRR